MISNSRGFTLIEVLSAAAILGVFSLAAGTMHYQAKRMLIQTIDEQTIKNEADYIMESVKDLASLSQVNFDPNSLTAVPGYLDTDVLPLVFDRSFSGTIPECLERFSITVPTTCLDDIPSCSALCPLAGRYGYTVTPFVSGSETPENAAARGIYRVTLKMKHPRFTQVPGGIKKYSFIIGAK